MALEYRLTLAGGVPVEQMAQRAFPDPDERPAGTHSPLSADLDEKYGFGAFITARRNGYFSAESDDGTFEWEPGSSASVTFRMDKFADFRWEVVNMLTVVRRVLDSGPEDAVLILNGDVLLLARFGGVLVKHRPSWWTSYPGANDVVPG